MGQIEKDGYLLIKHWKAIQLVQVQLLNLRKRVKL